MSILKGKTFAHITLGCKVNLYDTQAMVEILKNHSCKVVDFDDKADIYIINTCTVTNLGDKKSRQALRKAVKTNPEAVVVACGCYSQIDPNAVKKIEGVSILIGTQDRMRIAEFIIRYLEGREQKDFVSNISNQKEFEDLSISTMDKRARVYIKIQEGCDRYCAYCIIPYVRGPVRSRMPENVISEAKRLSMSGCKEIVLTGIHIASYGKDIKDTNLVDILHKLHDIDGIERIRFGSVDPHAVTEELLETMGNLPKLCDHIHLSLQSGCDKTLKAMNRRYNTAEYSATVEKLRAIMPDCGITTDVIVGFPGESEEDFNESLNFAKLIGFSGIHVFPYSPKTGTKAAAMENQIPSQIKNLRAKQMGELGLDMAQDFTKKFENTKLKVLFEQKIGNNIYEGHSSNYITFRQESTIDIENCILETTASYIKEGCLYGKNLKLN
ncbi:MAG: tRNA (N(6)-L-threonylcarbamoyladenosine(37)-C(2))-methylthiotransferase MtaB [Defluviitaleaceae bacterium]|nr:tRNA (N(6)-L-threonylcarbamoyladenosine(37)-C(2))-methylthiotransferase MtaB [Defluviitaleaceae bacterium]